MYGCTRVRGWIPDARGVGRATAGSPRPTQTMELPPRASPPRLAGSVRPEHENLRRRRRSAVGAGPGENDNETLTHTDLAPGRVVSQDEVTRLESGAKRRKSGLQCAEQSSRAHRNSQSHAAHGARLPIDLRYDDTYETRRRVTRTGGVSSSAQSPPTLPSRPAPPTPPHA